MIMAYNLSLETSCVGLRLYQFIVLPLLFPFILKLGVQLTCYMYILISLVQTSFTHGFYECQDPLILKEGRTADRLM